LRSPERRILRCDLPPARWLPLGADILVLADRRESLYLGRARV
jgi:hypothetical protein